MRGQNEHLQQVISSAGPSLVYFEELIDVYLDMLDFAELW